MNISKKTRSIIVLTFCLFYTAIGFAQICIDGDFCPNPGNGDPAGNCDDPTVLDEWGTPGFVNAAASSSCEFAEFYAILDNGNLNLGVTKGNQGAAHFFVYFDTDCDLTTGDPDHNGADKVLQFRVRQSGNPTLEILGVRCWIDPTGFGPLQNTAGFGTIADGASDGCGGSDLDFVEIAYPILGIVDPCQEGCSAITVVFLESRSGWSENSSLCDQQSVSIEIPVNEIPTAVISEPGGPYCVGETVIFDGSSSVDIIPVDDMLMYCWDIDYPGTGPIVCDETTPTISVDYNTAGLFGLALVVTDSFGCMDTVIFEVGDIEVVDAPIADGIIDFDPCTLELTYDGSVSMDGAGLDNLVFSWDFGDGGMSTTESGTYTYADCTSSGLVTLTVTDPDVTSPDCQSASLDFTIIFDLEPPTVTCPPPATVGCDEDIPTFETIADFIAAGGVILDMCPASTIAITNTVTDVGTCPVSQTITYTYEITDPCGNVGSCDFEVNLVTDQAPVILSCPDDVILECGMSTDTADLGVPVFEPNPCGINLVVVDVVMGGSCPDEMEIMRTFTAVDPCLGDASCTQIIMITDPSPPMFDDPIPADIEIECASEIPPPETINMTDNCGSMFMIMPTDVIIPGSCPNDFILERTWSMSDPCGNVAEATQTITVSDISDPVLLDPFPLNLDLECAADVPPPTDLTFIDNCDGPITVSPTEVITPGTCANDFTITRTWEYLDMCGNGDVIFQTITVSDISDPVLLDPFPLNLDLECAADVPPPIDLNILDNCDGPLVISPAEVITPGACVNDFIVTRTWDLSDLCGNGDIITQTITVSDVTAPVLDPTPPVDVAVECADDIPDPIDLEFIDNCGESGIVTPVDVILPGICPNRFSIERTWTAIDACGNDGSHTQLIVVDDITPPTLMCQDITVDLEMMSTVVLIPEDFILSVSDNCGDVTIVTDPPEFDCSDILPDSSATVEIIATDLCGNVTECTATVTFINFPELELFCPGDTTIFLGPGECNAIIPYDVSAINPCGDPALITQLDTTGFTSGDGFPIGTTIQEYMATNEYGDTLTCSFNITVVENDDPNDALVCNDLVNISVDQNCMVEITADIILEGNNFGCEDSLIVVVLTIHGDTVLNPITYDPDYSPNNNNYIVCVTDPMSGNTCCGEINLEDKLEPSIECPCPEGAWLTDPACQRTCLNMNQLTGGTIGTPIVSDNCAGVNAVFGGATIVEVGCGEYLVEQTWTVEIDGSNGGSFPNTTCTNQYLVTPIDLSLVTIPGLAEFECTELGDPNLTHPDNTGYPRLGGDNLGTVDNNDNPYCNLFATYTDLEFPACGNACSGPVKIYRSWSIMDWCTGEIEEFGQLIKVSDSEAPTIQASDVFTSTGPWECAADVWFENIQVHDNCSYDLDWYIVSTNSGATLVDDEGRTNSNEPKKHALGVPKGEWEFVIGSLDCCGNLGTTTIMVTVADLAAPVAISTQNIVISLTSGGTNGNDDTAGKAKIFNVDIDNGSFDNCSGVGLEIRRDNACDGSTSGTYSNKIPASCDPWYDTNDHDYGEIVEFCCDDLMADGDGDGEPDGLVKVWMRVWDDANMDGEFGSYTFFDNPGNDHDYCEFNDNFNETWSYVKVEDKGVPNLICPPNITIPCDWDYTDLSITGNATGSATCDIVQAAYTDWADLHCGEGTVLREWYFDSNGNGEQDGEEGDYTCTQIITITSVDTPPLADRVICPTVQGDNKVIIDCADFDIPDPFVTEGACSLSGISSDIDTFWFEEGACYKVIKTWRILDWCTGEEFACDFTVSLIDSEVPEIMCADTCIGVDDFWDADNDGNYCEFASNITLTNSAGDGGECGSEWIKWIIQIDYWGDGTIDAEASSFVPPNAPNYKAPTAAGADVSMTLLRDEASAAWARHLVKWKAFDGCGNVSQCTQVVEVGDKTAPTPYCIGISTALMDSDPPLVEIWANDFNLGSFDNCSTEDQLLYTFDETAPNVDKLDEVHCFDASGEVPCSQYENGFPVQKWNPATGTSGTKFVGTEWCGENDIRVSVWDEKFNTAFCWVTLIIHGEDCLGVVIPRSDIAGTISTESGETVAGVDVTVISPTQPEYPRFDNTVEDGYYAFMDNLHFNTYQISADKTGDWLNGVSTLDLVLIQRHILQLQSLDSGYKLIAADINSDESISGIDLVELRKLILGIYDELPQNDSWRFPIANQGMTMDPFPFTEAIDIVGLDADMMEEDFVGVKIGDVNGSVTANLLDVDVDTRSASTVDFEVEALGQNLIEVRAGENFTDVYGYQFTMQLNGTLEGVRSGALQVDASNFGILKAGVITTSFSGTEANTFAEGTLLFTLEVAGGTDLSLVSGVTRAEAYVSTNLELAEVSMRGGKGELAAFALGQNEPNPFGETTQIGFTLGKAGQATLTVMDVTGKVLTVVSGDYESGSHVIELTKGQLGTSGVMYYQLESGNFTATKKMIVLD